MLGFVGYSTRPRSFIAAVTKARCILPSRVVGREPFQTGRPNSSTNCSAIASGNLRKFAAIAIFCPCKVTGFQDSEPDRFLLPVHQPFAVTVFPEFVAVP